MDREIGDDKVGGQQPLEHIDADVARLDDLDGRSPANAQPVKGRRNQHSLDFVEVDIFLRPEWTNNKRTSCSHRSHLLEAPKSFQAKLLKPISPATFCSTRTRLFIYARLTPDLCGLRGVHFAEAVATAIQTTGRPFSGLRDRPGPWGRELPRAHLKTRAELFFVGDLDFPAHPIGQRFGSRPLPD